MGARKKKCKILLVSNSTWNIYNFRLNLVKHLCLNGFEVVIAAPVDQYIHYLYVHPNVSHIPIKHLERGSLGVFSNIKLLEELLRIYKNVRPDLIIQYTIKPNIFGSLAARVSGIPSISVITGLGYSFMENDLLNKIVRQLYRFSLKKNKKIVFENPDDLQLFVQKKIIPVHQGKVVNGCGVDTYHFHPIVKEKNNKKFVFTFIGRLLYDKGILEFVEAASNLKKQGFDASFWVVGDVDGGNPSSVNKKDIVEWVRNRIIVYKGETQKIKSILSKTDCLVLPSYREGLSKSILEAMAMEVPVITTDVPGCRQAIYHGINGWLVPPKDLKALEIVMENALQLSQDQLHTIGWKNRADCVANFSDTIIIQQYCKLISQILPTAFPSLLLKPDTQLVDIHR